MNLPTTNPSDRPQMGQEIPAPHRGPFKRIRNLLRRKDSAELAGISSAGSLEPPDPLKPSIVERLERFFTYDLPSGIEILPMDTQTPSTPAGSETADESRSSATAPETMGPKNDPGVTSDLIAVRSIRVAAKDAIAQCQDDGQENEPNFKDHAQVFERSQDAAATVEGLSPSLQQLQVKITKDLTDEFEKASEALLTRSAKQLQEQADAALAALAQNLSAQRERFVAETQKQFEEHRASRQAFVDDTQKQLTAMAQSSLDSLTKAAVEKACAELDASKQSVIDDSQKQLASMSRTSLEMVASGMTRDLVDQVRSELIGSRQAFIQDTQDYLAKMTQDSLEQLQSLAKTSINQASTDLMALGNQFMNDAKEQVAGMTQTSLELIVKTAVEQGRRELSDMVNKFLAKGIPEIEAELRKLVDRYSEAAHRQGMHAQITDTPRLTPVHPVASQGHEFALVASAPRRRIGVRDGWPGLSFGMRLGFALGLMVLLTLAVYLSASPVVRLRLDPPVAFFDESPSWTAKQRAREHELARAYWDIAFRDIETTYSFGSPLPVDPPDSFKVEEKGPNGTPSKVDTAARTRYWKKVREVWPQSNSWEHTLDWNLNWIRDAWDSASSKITHFFSPIHPSTDPAP